MRVDLHPEARNEFRSAALWYEERRNGLGEELVAAIDATIQKISNSPGQFPRWPGTEKASAIIRKAPVDRFPFNLPFEEHDEYLLILAIAHQKRRPLYWLERESQQH